MTCINIHCFSLNRILLLFLGLWPFQQSILVRFQLTLCFAILTSFIVFQFTRLMTAECTINFVIKILSCTLLFVMYVIKYNSFCINSQTIRCLLEQFQHIYNELKDENEIAILEKYGYYAKSYTIKIILIAICGEFIFIFLSLLPRIFDILQPTNKSRSVIILTEYFVDQEKYFYFILLHMNAAYCIGLTAMIATGTMLIAYFKHICGMFKIASYRIEQAMTINILCKNQKHESIIHKEIIFAIDIHRKALKFAEYIITNFEGSLFFLIAVSVSCLSLNLFRIFQVMSLEDGIDELLLHFIVVINIVLYMFLANYAGQEITDHNNDVFFTAYNVHWYIAPLHIQKLILILLQRGNKTFSLNVGGLFAASLKCFASLTSASISYFTVIYSTQQ